MYDCLLSDRLVSDCRVMPLDKQNVVYDTDALWVRQRREDGSLLSDGYRVSGDYLVTNYCLLSDCLVSGDCLVSDCLAVDCFVSVTPLISLPSLYVNFTSHTTSHSV